MSRKSANEETEKKLLWELATLLPITLAGVTYLALSAKSATSYIMALIGLHRYLDLAIIGGAYALMYLAVIYMADKVARMALAIVRMVKAKLDLDVRSKSDEPQKT